MVYHPQDRTGRPLTAAGPGDDGDTIAAQATPPGRGGVGIIRVSGPRAGAIARAVTGKELSPRQAEYLPFFDSGGEVLDQGIALFFAGPHSFTGEDVLELQGHGGPVIMDMLLRRVQELGARMARPGEFSLRAFLNDKLDLAQAEAIADLIDSSTEAAARSALKSLRGEFSRRIEALLEQLIELRVFVESAIDFPEEEIDFLADPQLRQRLDRLANSLQEVLAAAGQGCLLREGMNLVILGRPNAGKSSLLNRLAGRDSAIVTAVPGTTRDVLREQIQLDGMPVNVIDTAGLRDSGDEVEREGMRRAWEEVGRADRVLLVFDDSTGFGTQEKAILRRLPAGLEVTLVRNKIDLSGGDSRWRQTDHGPSIGISAREGLGLDVLKAHLKQVMGYQGSGDNVFMARRRHVEALERARAAVERGRRQLVEHGAGELLAEELRQAQQALNEITGEFDNEALLGRIFASFCIGK